jgi:hypothetical protein
VFNVARPIEAMFYAQATFSPGLPDEAVVETALAKGFRVAVHADPEELPTNPLHDDPRVTWLPRYPGTRDVHHLATLLLAMPSHRLALHNVDQGDLLEDYLESLGLSVSVNCRMPQSGAELERDRREGRTPVVLLRPGAELPKALRKEPSQALFIVDPVYAAPPR